MIGAGPLGALAGGFGGSGNSQQDQANQALQDYYKKLLAGGQAPQTGPAAQAGYSDFRSNQRNLIDRLEAMSNGQGPSLAMAQLQAATDKNLSATQAMTASGRGGPLAAAQAMNQMQRTQAQASQDSVASRIAEEQMALGQLGGAINAGRQSDEGVNTFNAGQSNQMAIANMEARLRKMGMDNAAIQAVIQQMFGASQLPQLGDKILGGSLQALGMAQGMKGGGGAPGGGGGGGFGSYGPSGYNSPPTYGGGGGGWGWTPQHG